MCDKRARTTGRRDPYTCSANLQKHRCTSGVIAVSASRSSTSRARAPRPEQQLARPLEEALRGGAGDQDPLRAGGFRLPPHVRAILFPKISFGAAPRLCVLQIEEDDTS